MRVKNKMTMYMPNNLLKFTSVLISFYYVLKMTVLSLLAVIIRIPIIIEQDFDANICVIQPLI